MDVNIADVAWEASIYPRSARSEKTVEAYTEALALGAQFPPIKIQHVFNYPADNGTIEATLILDGIHRLSRLGWPQEQIAELTRITRGRMAQIVNNANFSEINNLLSQGRDMDYIAY